MDYPEFIKQKQQYGADDGFEPLWIPDYLFDFQKHLADWSIRKGRAAIFADCGMGKTICQLVWANNVIRKTNKPVLILTPLSVTGQTLGEAKKFGIEAYRAIPGQTPKEIGVTNYEKIHYFDPLDYAGVVCDESSILKNFKGKRKAQITEFMRIVSYRLLCTATAAPNDWEELGTSSEAIGYYGYQDMISKFFTNKQKSGALMGGRFWRGRDKWLLRKYAADGPFWQWVVSWARAARSPGDLGFEDENNTFTLPRLIENDIEVSPKKSTPGMLFDMEAVNWNEEREVIRRTITERCEEAANRVIKHKLSMVWCNLNPEGKLLKKLIPNSVEICGSDSDEKREEAIDWFINGTEEERRLISKAKIFGLGMNFQHAYHSTYFPDNSYEKYYQATRREWRFGQKNDVIVDRVFTNGGSRMLANLDRKARQADEMFAKLVEYMNDAISLENTYNQRKVSVPKWITS